MKKLLYSECIFLMSKCRVYSFRWVEFGSYAIVNHINTHTHTHTTNAYMFESRYCSQALSLGVMSTYSINTMSVHIQRQRPSLGPGQNVVKHYFVNVVCCKYFMDILPFLWLPRAVVCVPARAVAVVCVLALADAVCAVTTVCEHAQTL